MANYTKEIDHYEVILQNYDGITYAIKEFFAEDEAIEYAKAAFNAQFTVTVKEVDNIIWW